MFKENKFIRSQELHINKLILYINLCNVLKI